MSRIGNATKSSYYQAIKEKLVYLYKKEINKKFEKIKNNILNMVELTQYHSIELLNFELCLKETLKLIFFNSKIEPNIENIIKENNINDNNNNLLLNNEINIINNENENLIEEDIINIENNRFNYKDFLNEITQTYINQYNSILFQKFENVINNCFHRITSHDVKEELFKRVEKKEIRSYAKIEREEHLAQESDKFIESIKNIIDNQNLIEDENLVEQEENLINNINYRLTKKSQLYKINNESILKIKEI